MPLQDYVDLRNDIRDILTIYGAQFKMTRPVVNDDGSVADKVLGSNIYGTLDAQLVAFVSTTGNSLIASDKKTLYLVPFANEPEVGDTVSDAAKNVWRVTNIELFRPDGVTLICWMLSLT